MRVDWIGRFNEIANEISKSGRCLGQNVEEYSHFLSFSRRYFDCRAITQPIVVEIGTLANAQKTFYESLLNAEHIGIDLNPHPKFRTDIIGDSRHASTTDRLRERLRGRMIDLLFIDGDHSYDTVKSDYEIYGSMTRHLVAFHDLCCPDLPGETDVDRFWKDLVTTEKRYLFMTFYKPRKEEKTTIWPGHEMGIGLVVKDGR